LIDQPSIPLELYPGDCILLASDGIFTLSEAEIRKILQQQDLSAQQLVQKLLKAVQDKGKSNQDNTTVLVVKIPDTMEVAPKIWRWQTGILLSLLTLVLMLWIGTQLQLIDLVELLKLIWRI